jgi:hypothetical protein
MTGVVLMAGLAGWLLAACGNEVSTRERLGSLRSIELKQETSHVYSLDTTRRRLEIAEDGRAVMTDVDTGVKQYADIGSSGFRDLADGINKIEIWTLKPSYVEGNGGHHGDETTTYTLRASYRADAFETVWTEDGAPAELVAQRKAIQVVGDQAQWRESP